MTHEKIEFIVYSYLQYFMPHEWHKIASSTIQHQPEIEETTCPIKEKAWSFSFNLFEFLNIVYVISGNEPDWTEAYQSLLLLCLS